MPEDVAEKLRKEETRVINILEAIQSIKQTREWSSLKELLFDGLVQTLLKELRVEARRDDPDPKKLNRISGELKWAERYSNLDKLEESYRVELQRIRISYGKKPE